MTLVTGALNHAMSSVAATVGAVRAWLLQTARGQGLVEYALILVLIAVTAIGAIALFGDRVDEMYSNINCGVIEATQRIRPPECT